MIDRDGSRPTDENIKSIKNFQRPRTVKQVRSFIGTINFYRNFIRGITDIAAPLYALIKKGRVGIDWTDECDSSFNHLKQALISAPVLVHPNYEVPFIIKSDASNIAVGAVLEQEVNGELHPLAYCSRKLNRAEQNYSVIEREALATVYALQQFRHYVYGYEIHLYTDHKPLSYVFKLKDSNQRLMRWMLQIQDYQLKIQHLPGKFNFVADMLSRKAEAEGVIRLNALGQVHKIISNQYIKDAQSGDDLCKDIVSRVKNDEIENEDYILDENKVLLKQVFPNRESGWRFRILVPKAIRNNIIANYHDQIYSGHFSAEKVMWKVKQLFTWDRMFSDIREYVRSCEKCQKRNVHRTRAPFQAVDPPSFPIQRLSCDILGPFSTTDRKNKYLVVWCDHFSRYCWASPIPNMEASTIAQDFIDNIFSHYGAPQEIITDRGANFTGGLFTSLCAKLGAKKINTTSFHPCSNGVSERLNSKIISVLSHICNSRFSDWDLVLSLALLSIRNTVHRSTGESPMYLLHCFDAVDPLVEASVTPDRVFSSTHDFIEQVTARAEMARSAISDHLMKSSENNCDARNANRRLRDFEVGQKVLLLDPTSYSGKNRKLKPRFVGPFRIVERRGIVNYKIRDLKNSNSVKLVHVDKLKPFYEKVVFDDGIPPGKFVARKGHKSSPSNVPPIHEQAEEDDDEIFFFGRDSGGKAAELLLVQDQDSVPGENTVNLNDPISLESPSVCSPSVIGAPDLSSDAPSKSSPAVIVQVIPVPTRLQSDTSNNLGVGSGDVPVLQTFSPPSPAFSGPTKPPSRYKTYPTGDYNLRSRGIPRPNFISQTGYPPLRDKKN